ncbi:XRE family transcriptional regulator [Brevibacterium album]|uniref:XRE family transcriptional regulator n=1 Tax=Brevibacterium album TaxID=417948 RepID=UPI0004137049|nr:XRE family transcriptional regulator [Brevibacterium album]
MRLEPTRITLARARAGLTKAELARHLGVEPRSVTNYETRGAPERLAPALAQATGFRLGYFTRGEVEPIDGTRAFFRARRRTSARVKHSAVAAGRTGTEVYRLITDRFRLPALNLPDLSGMEPESAAVTVRAQWDLGVMPAPNLVQLAESKGVRVLGLPGSTSDVDAFSVWDDGAPYVFLSRQKTAERARFDLAHELGHLVLHSGSCLDETAVTDIEREADHFASAFLLPAAEVSAVLGREPSVTSILAAKRRFRVSAVALAYRLRTTGQLTEWTYRTTAGELASLGYRTGEPDGILHERSRVFTTVLARLREKHGLGTEAMADLLGVPAEEIHGLTLGHALTASGTGTPPPADSASAAGSHDGPAAGEAPTAEAGSRPRLRVVR